MSTRSRFEILLVAAVALGSSRYGRAAVTGNCAQAVIAPADGTAFTPGDPDAFELKLEWNAVAGVKTYRVEVGTEPVLAPGQRAFAAEVPWTHYSARGLRPGHYYWRVAAVGGSFVGPTCAFSITPAPFPNTPSVLGAIPSGRPLARGGAFYCDDPGGPPKPFGLFFVQPAEAASPDASLTVCTGDKLSHAFAHRFGGELSLRTLSSKTLRVGLVSLPNGAGLLVAIAPTAEGVVLVCRTAGRYDGVPVGKSCSGAGVTVTVPDPAKLDAVEVLFPDGRKERIQLPEMVVP